MMIMCAPQESPQEYARRVERDWRIFRASIEHEVQALIVKEEVADDEQVIFGFQRHRIGFKRVRALFVHRKGNRSKYEIKK